MIYFSVAPIQRSAVLAIALALFAIQPALAQEMLRTLTVTGRGSQAITATLADVSLGVEVQGKTAQEVQQEVARRSNAVVNALRGSNVSQLQTTGISLMPNYQYTNNQRVLVGYIGRNTVSFQIGGDRAGQILDGAVNAGATTINNISFTAPDANLTDARNVALQRATQDAQTQAQVVLSSLNLRPNQVVNIQINQATPPSLPVMRATALSADATPVLPGELTVEATVTLQISY
ncbi:SIMPL domain-containing protein [Candidatus Synechococcus calcipolaris G9]|uniref:SIMPL domain-containing protein n=1 Tax=Candidatus Synechococcus calcipolaris G9 TaxID=1497997 RepID=A0ABT6EU78_9SYNE|nr:SIMPL domain-containing protein [Candidatus Synechococcus calcipolaris]MDG2989441.1 SIMPL domain-containing protein [Candidatus Synechococcus calcipolaris G9]